MSPCDKNPETRKELEKLLKKCEGCKKYIHCDKVLKLYDKLYDSYDITEKINGSYK